MLNLCRIWVNEPDVNIRVVALSRNGALRSRFQEMGVPAEYYNTRTLRGFLAFRRSLIQAVQQGIAPEVIHTNLLWPDLICRYFCTLVPKAQLISTNHGLHAVGEKSSLGGKLYGLAERITRGRCNGWIAVSGFVASALKQAGYNEASIHKISNGVDCARFSPSPAKVVLRFRRKLGIAPGQPLLLAVGNFRLVKNHALLIEAMVQVRATFPTVRLMLVGNGPLKATYKKLIRERSLQGVVTLHSPKQVVLPLLMSSADLLVHCSHTESFGLVVAETLACQTPVVVTDVGALPELVLPGKTGALVEPDRILPLASAVCSLLVDPQLRQMLGKNGRQHIQQHYNIAKTAQQYLAFWRKIRTNS